MKGKLDSDGVTQERKRPSLLMRVRLWFFVNVFALIVLITVHFAFNLASLRWWSDIFAVLTNLLTGGFVSFLFYYLVVYLPENQRKIIIKLNLQKMYSRIKRDILWAVVRASIEGGRRDLPPDFDFVDKLASVKIFRETFEGGREANEGFYAFENQMSRKTQEFSDIVLSLTMLSKQIEYVLHNYNITNREIFDFFKRLELLLMKIQANGAGYDESKPLCRFIWEVCAGWDWVKGDIGHDRIQKMIDEL